MAVCVALIWWSTFSSAVQLDDRCMQNTSEVWEVVNLLEVGFTNGDVENWKSVFGAVLVSTLVFLTFMVRPKRLFTSIAKVVDSLLQVISRMAGSSIVICVLGLSDGSGAGMSS